MIIQSTKWISVCLVSLMAGHYRNPFSYFIVCFVILRLLPNDYDCCQTIVVKRLQQVCIKQRNTYRVMLRDSRVGLNHFLRFRIQWYLLLHMSSSIAKFVKASREDSQSPMFVMLWFRKLWFHSRFALSFHRLMLFFWHHSENWVFFNTVSFHCNF